MLYSLLRQLLRNVFGGGADISAANPLETHDPKVGSLISYEGTTTADGAGGGLTLVCSDLTTKPDFDGNLVIITSGAYEGQARDINGVTTGGTVTPSRAFGGLIVSGTNFVIVGITTTPAEVAAIEAKLDHATYGLAALKTLIDAVEGKLDGVSGLAALKAVVDAILVDTGTTLDTEVADIKTQTDKIAGKMLFSMDFWSDTQEELQVDAAGGTETLPTVTIADFPATATVVRAIAMFKFRMVENTYAGANAINGAQHIQVQKAGGTWRDAISIADNLFTFTAAAREGGDALIGDHDIALEVDANATYNFQWVADADQEFIQFNDCQVGLKIFYSV